MKEETLARPVSGTLFEAIDVLQSHSQVRPVSAPVTGPFSESQHCLITPNERVSLTTYGTMVMETEVPRTSSSRSQHQVASSRTLDEPSRIVTSAANASADLMAETHSPLPPKIMIARAKALLSPRSANRPNTAGGYKAHGLYCQTKSAIMRSLRWSKKTRFEDPNSPDSLRSGYYAAITHPIPLCDSDDEAYEEVSEDSSMSGISDKAPQIPLLRPVSKFMPNLTINVPENKLANTTFARQGGFKDESDYDSLYAEPSDLHMTNKTLVMRNNKEGSETSFHCTAKEDDDVFSATDDRSQAERQVSDYMLKFRQCTKVEAEDKKPLTAPSTISPSAAPTTPPRLRHTTLCSSPGLCSTSLRSQYSACDSPSGRVRLEPPRRRTPNEHEMGKSVRLTPSLESIASAHGLEIFEENAVAVAAPIVRGVEPHVVHVRSSRMVETLGQRPLSDLMDSGLTLADRLRRSGSKATVAPLRIHSKAPSRMLVRSPTFETSPAIPKLPFQVVETIVFSAAWGDAECQDLAAHMYDEVAKASASNTESRWDGRTQYILRQSHLMQKLRCLVQFDNLRQDIFESIRGQLYPTETTVMMSTRDFKVFIQRAVHTLALNAVVAEEVLQSAVVDKGFAQSSPEEEVFFERQPFNPEGFVYSDGTNEAGYERLGSLPGAVVRTVEHTKPQPLSGCRAPFWAKMGHIFRWKRRS